MANKAAFLAWLKGARPGDRRHYHVGFLILDRQYSPALDALAEAAYAAYKDGVATLVQRRIKPGIYEYIAEAL